ncbi:MAG TPA: flagellar assembly protein FliH [Spirochaetota bacterium]|nr:flagellar assembly protein FliH [Spirochaetota bacterium]HOM38871.1 flagellar assembly protein FliH [Spirochaetota bacterium]HPQ49166.1 flagellar assembly protein FliH [Spirochaetota bacterium]
MSKVIKSDYIKDINRPVIIEPPVFETKEEGIEEERREEIKGPSEEELQKIIEEKKREAEEEAEKIIKKANEDAQKIRDEAENYAFNKVKKINEEFDSKMKEAEFKAKVVIDDANQKAKLIIEDAQKEAEKIKKESYSQGFEIGREEGYKSGQEEVNRLIGVLHKVVGELIKKRESIVEETENQLVDLVLLIAKKVVKVITESQKRVIYDNVIAAINKLRIRSEITIRVNPEDVYTVTKYKKDFMEAVEGIENIRILEDPNVDKGGCIVTSEFGSVDARISTQLAEIEEQIKKLSPIKNE